ncbi:MAG TPA: FtsW/RodA/SpoVE family cell cycle protein [Vicinamibacterales bacterium]|nr:FtsW/RodA/SpoVE family cell cycle protein [Vicinamibacterales bacterium]
MGLTYTHGRDLVQQRTRVSTISLGEQLLVATSLVVVLAITLAYAGRVRAEAWGKEGQAAPVNLNSINKPEEIEPALAAVIATPAERKTAAAVIAAATPLSNVGALARMKNGDQPLFTGAQVAALKPLLSVRTIDEFRSAVLWCSLATVLAFQFVSLVWRLRGVPGDRTLLTLAHLLVGIGFVMMISRPDPLRDTLLISRYTAGVVIGLVLFAAVSLINLDRAAFRELTYLPLVGALGLSVLLILFGSGPGSSSAKVNLGPVQPIEAIRLLLALFLAGYFARRWELLRQVRTETIRNRRLPAWINLPRLDHVLPVAAGVGMALVLFFFQKDLGPALLLSLMFLSLFAIARGGAWLACAGLAGLVAGFGIGYLANISSTLTGRLAMWGSAWDNAVRGGDQVAQGLWGLAAGAVSGTGAGLGNTRFIPEGHTDLIFAAIGEELGLVGLIVTAAAFALIAARGVQIARRASSDYRFFLAIALTLATVVPALVMAAGVLGVLPLTGVVTPFLSYGGSAMAVNFVSLGLLVAIDRDRGWRAKADLAPFRVPVRWLGRVAAAAAGVMLVVAAGVQTVRADEYLVRPQLSVQADGGRRFQYNPRVLEALRNIPRGSIYDARGDVLATSDPATIAKLNASSKSPASGACADSSKRCYPAGPALFHILGDTNTRENWSAANSSYVERDSEDLLRGFDDHATTVTTTDRNGHNTVAVRRDYASVVPLVRHRWEPDHPDAKAVLTRSRDVRLTIDGRLQLAVASILERAVKASGSGKGAVVVLDAATGQVLASVSWPLGTEGPRESFSEPSSENDSRGRFLDRARYALYPPGSTFKVVTAAAALRQNPAAADQHFSCTRLPSHRIGVRIPGFGPPVVDDVKDPDPHGDIAMHDAMVRSCNAYFAQLAVALGSDALAQTAATAGITLNSSKAADRVRANLPHAGYGQGEVVTTPLRMARVVAAIASDGMLREAPLAMPRATGAGAPKLVGIETAFVPPGGARQIASYLRDAVTGGTGRLLRDHPARIAGKTGTAELDEAASHAWFVGFAPYSPSTRRIAFAVVLENAGYGGVSAANVAGQVATSATTLGIIK